MPRLTFIISYFLLIFCTNPAMAQLKDYTSKVKNTESAWGATGTYKAGDVTCMEYYSSGHFYHGTFHQTISDLPIGVYEAEVYFNASCASWECAEICGNGTTGRVHLFMNDAEVDVPIYNIKQIEAPTLYTIKNIHVSDGTLYMGARNDREGANWHLIRLKSLKYLGTDARSLYDAQFPMIRKARLALAASTCPENQKQLEMALNESLVASANDTPEYLQKLYDNISFAISESEAFEAKKTTALKNLVSRLSYFQRTWNNGARTVNSDQWGILLPAVERACTAKDSECDLDAMNNARSLLNQAMIESSGIAQHAAPSSKSGSCYTIDGRKISPNNQGLIIRAGEKVIE